MATKLTKAVTRATGMSYKGGKGMVVQLTTQGVLIKLEGQRWDNASFVPYEAVFDLGCKLAIRADSSPVTRVKRGLLRP